MITAAQIAAACGCPLARAVQWAPALSEAMHLYGIDTSARRAAFLAQVAHESGRLLFVREIWGPTPAQLGYEGRRDLGNVRPGDGRRYCGHGPIQITGRANHARARDELRLLVPTAPDFEASPEMLEIPRWGALAAAEFWSRRGLNALADVGTPEACKRISRAINGGDNGLADRLALWHGACAALA